MKALPDGRTCYVMPLEFMRMQFVLVIGWFDGIPTAV